MSALPEVASSGGGPQPSTFVNSAQRRWPIKSIRFAINRAIGAAAAAGGWYVSLPDGTYIGLSIKLMSHVRLPLTSGDRPSRGRIRGGGGGGATAGLRSRPKTTAVGGISGLSDTVHCIMPSCPPPGEKAWRNDPFAARDLICRGRESAGVSFQGPILLSPRCGPTNDCPFKNAPM